MIPNEDDKVQLESQIWNDAPAALPVIAEGIPAALKVLPRWVLWRYEPDAHGKPQKVPYRATGNGKASSSNPAMWSPFEAALARYGAGGFAGIGFMFDEADGIVGIDLDDCRDQATGRLSDRAVSILERLASYSEVSPSGTGVKAWIRGAKSFTRCGFPIDSPDLGKVEVYSKARYFCVTGHVLDGFESIREASAELTALHDGGAFAPTGRAATGKRSPFEGRATNDDRPDAERRCIEYLAKCEPAVSGQGGHSAMLWAARVAVLGFDLGAEAGFNVLWKHFNPRCVPPWTEAELRHKCQDADTKPFDKPRGWLLEETPDANRNGQASDSPSSKPSDPEDRPRESASTRLVSLALSAGLELFHDAGQAVYADIRIDGVRQTWPLRAGSVKTWLARLAHAHDGRVPGSQAVADALNLLKGKAQYDGPEQPVHLRVAGHASRLYLDLANEKWQVVEIDATGWRIVDEPPVRFRRPRAMRPLPEPAQGGSLDDLRQLCNVADADWPLLIAWLTATFRPSGPYPLLVLTGEQGSAKSTTAKNIRELIDPNAAPLRGDPKDARDLAIGAQNSWVVAYDNLSRLPEWLSNAMCRLSTGGGFATRELFSDGEEVVFDSKRPALVTAIGDVIAAPDLLDRSILIGLQPIGEASRKLESAMEASLETLRPRILGAILDAVSGGLRLLPSIQLQHLPRMADFALWGEAVWQGLGNPPDEFLDAYRSNIGEANNSALESSVVAVAVIRFMETRSTWEGTAAELLSALTTTIGEEAARKRQWPTSPSTLSAALAKSAPALRRCGITFERGKRGKERRRITLSSARNRKSPSSPSPPSPPAENASFSGVSGDSGREGSPSPPSPSPASPSPVPAPEPPENKAFSAGDDGGDGDDGDFPSLCVRLASLLERLRAADSAEFADTIERIAAADPSEIGEAIAAARRVLGDAPGDSLEGELS